MSRFILKNLAPSFMNISLSYYDSLTGYQVRDSFCPRPAEHGVYPGVGLGCEMAIAIAVFDQSLLHRGTDG